MKRWLKQLFCRHSEITDALTVSGYGYSEYKVWWCCQCEKYFSKQTRSNND